MSEKKNGPAVLDLDSVRPERRLVKLAGKEIDVTRVPFGIMLDIVDKLDDFVALEKGENNGKGVKEALQFLHKATLDVCCGSNPEITREWLQENTDVVQMVQLMSFVVAPLLERMADSKNLLAAGFEANAR